MTSAKENLREAMLQAFGTCIEREYDFEILYGKIAKVIAAHVFAGNQGDDLLCQINRLLEKEEK